jgi:hypothetical protein
MNHVRPDYRRLATRPSQALQVKHKQGFSKMVQFLKRSINTQNKATKNTNSRQLQVQDEQKLAT